MSCHDKFLGVLVKRAVLFRSCSVGLTPNVKSRGAGDERTSERHLHPNLDKPEGNDRRGNVEFGISGVLSVVVLILTAEPTGRLGGRRVTSAQASVILLIPSTYHG